VGWDEQIPRCLFTLLLPAARKRGLDSCGLILEVLLEVPMSRNVQAGRFESDVPSGANQNRQRGNDRLAGGWSGDIAEESCDSTGAAGTRLRKAGCEGLSCGRGGCLPRLSRWGENSKQCRQGNGSSWLGGEGARVFARNTKSLELQLTAIPIAPACIMDWPGEHKSKQAPMFFGPELKHFGSCYSPRGKSSDGLQGCSQSSSLTASSILLDRARASMQITDRSRSPGQHTSKRGLKQVRRATWTGKTNRIEY
jgi:hypothetical protein